MSSAKKTQVSKLLLSGKAYLAKPAPTIAEGREMIVQLLNAVQLLANRMNLNSSNSSKPPSTDFNSNKKKSTARGRKRKAGGQKGHLGARLEPVSKPDDVEFIAIDRRTLPSGNWILGGFEKRQVFDIEVSFFVKEYQAEILINEKGIQYVADFPEGITAPTQYGSGVKATSVYLSQYQLIPLARVQDCFETQFNLPLTRGSVNNFNIYAANRLREWRFDDWMKDIGIRSDLLHADETGTNISGTKYWIHCLSNDYFTYFHVDSKRGTQAMERMGVLEYYRGKLVHDHWKPYFVFLCTHILCNAHHARELLRAYEQDGQKWAKKMRDLLHTILKETNKAGGKLNSKKIKVYQKKYREILHQGMEECPENSHGRAQSKSKNLLDRLIAYEEETLLFMKMTEVPFTNNLGERDLRMNKVQQKISGCFRSLRGAQDFCLIRSYLSTARKNGMQPIEALRRLFNNDPPEFIKRLKLNGTAYPD